MAEEILDALAQVQDLKVAGRTSSFFFKGKNEKLDAIGAALGVAHVLEGSVRTQGNKVRITGLGILQVRHRPARMGRNPATGEAIKIKASKKVAFRVAKDLKEAI